MIYLAFLGGVIIGTLLTLILRDRRSVRGSYKLIEVDDPDIETCTHNVIISIPDQMDLIKNKRIILVKDNSHK